MNPSENSNWWSSAFPDHYKSAYYDVEGFISNPRKLTVGQDVIDILGDVDGKSLLHLQCNFGLDTLSYARLGASVTGVDICDDALDAARLLANKCGSTAIFAKWDANMDSLQHRLFNSKYDIVTASYGVLEWIENIDQYFGQVASVLANGGKFILIEVHPVAKWLLRQANNQTFSYLDQSQSIESGISYASGEQHGVIISYHHTFSQVLMSALKSGLKIEKLVEYDSSSYRFHRSMCKRDERWVWPKLPSGAPMLFSLVASK